MQTGTFNATERPPFWVWPFSAFTAALLVNAVPHLVAGPLILHLPTPFSGGPGGLSSPMVNTLWGLSNILLGMWLMLRLRPWWDNRNVRWLMYGSAVAFTIFLTWAIGSQPLPGRFV